MIDKTSKNDDKIKALLKKVAEQEAALGVRSRAKWNTNAVFKYPNGDFFNLNTIAETQLEKLVAAMAFLLSSETLLEQAAKRLGVNATPFSHGGFTLSEWEEDFKLRISIVQYDTRKKQLDLTKKKLKSLISADTRTELELDEIESLLN